MVLREAVDVHTSSHKSSVWLPVVIGLAQPPVNAGDYIRPPGATTTSLIVRRVDQRGTVYAGNQAFDPGSTVERFSKE